MEVDHDHQCYEVASYWDHWGVDHWGVEVLVHCYEVVDQEQCLQHFEVEADVDQVVQGVADLHCVDCVVVDHFLGASGVY